MRAEKIRYGSVCSGIEAATAAWHPLGWAPAWFAEIEPFPAAVLAHHYPDTPNLGDMTQIARRILAGEIEAPDVLVGGTPCQAFSVAGLRESLNDERGSLTLRYVELADAIDFVRRRSGKPPVVIVWENVPGAISTKDNAFGCFLAGLAGEDVALEPAGTRWTNAGCVLGPQRTICWRTLDAQYFGLAQRRRRVFAVASARNGFDPVTVLLEWEGLRRDSPPSREARAGAACGALGGTSPGGGWRFGADEAAAGQLISSTGDISHCLNAGGMARQDYETETLVTHTLRGEGFDASEDGTGRGTPLIPVAFAENSRAELRLENGDGSIAGALSTGGGKPGQGVPCIAFDSRQDTVSSEHLFGALGSSSPQAQAIAFQSSQSGVRIGETHTTLDANNGPRRHNGVVQAMQVRRLTPRECERLQGFQFRVTTDYPSAWEDGPGEWWSPDYTLIPGKTRKINPEKLDRDYVKYLARGGRMSFDECCQAAADGPRYKALGNSMAVPCMRWIGGRIDRALREQDGSIAAPMVTV